MTALASFSATSRTNLRREFIARICGENLSHEFAARIYRTNLRQVIQGCIVRNRRPVSGVPPCVGVHRPPSIAAGPWRCYGLPGCEPMEMPVPNNRRSRQAEIDSECRPGAACWR